MGYTLKIGEAKIDYSEDDASIDCDTVNLPDAPAFGEATDHASERWPSYSGWADAMRTLGLTNMMFARRNGGADEFCWNDTYRRPLICNHPGAMPITKEHLEYVEAALAKYKAEHPTHVAQFPPLRPDAKPMRPGTNDYMPDQYVVDPRYDGALCRGEWLLWWLRWAVANCKQPVFVNS